MTGKGGGRMNLSVDNLQDEIDALIDYLDERYTGPMEGLTLLGATLVQLFDLVEQPVTTARELTEILVRQVEGRHGQ
jgi:hypothetical protein